MEPSRVSFGLLDDALQHGVDISLGDVATLVHLDGLQLGVDLAKDVAAFRVARLHGGFDLVLQFPVLHALPFFFAAAIASSIDARRRSLSKNHATSVCGSAKNATRKTGSRYGRSCRAVSAAVARCERVMLLLAHAPRAHVARSRGMTVALRYALMAWRMIPGLPDRWPACTRRRRR